MPPSLEIVTITPRVHNSGDRYSGAEYLLGLSMQLASCHLPTAYNFGLAPRFLENLCTPASRSYRPFQHCAPTRWKAATFSVTERKTSVFRRCNRAVSDNEKHGLQMKSTQPIMNSIVLSFIHSFIHSSHKFCYGNTWDCG